jgi:hypothetical protein
MLDLPSKQQRRALHPVASPSIFPMSELVPPAELMPRGCTLGLPIARRFLVPILLLCENNLELTRMLCVCLAARGHCGTRVLHCKLSKTRAVQHNQQTATFEAKSRIVNARASRHTVLAVETEITKLRPDHVTNELSVYQLRVAV